MKEKIKRIINNIGNKLNCFWNSMKLSENKFNSLELCLVIIMACVFGVLIGEMVFSRGGNKVSSDVSEIQTVYETLLEDYYGDVTEEKLTEAAIQGMIGLLGDKYSAYYDEAETDNFNEKLDGTFVGVGAEVTVTTEGAPIVITVFDNSPASKSGLKVGDIFVKLNGEDVSKMDVDELTNKIKGSTKKIELTMNRNGKEYTTTLVTSKINIPSVASTVYEYNKKKIGYIAVSIFALNTDEQFETELLKLEQSGIDGLIIDVRDNSGGHLDTVINMASLFLNKDEVICQIKSKDQITKKVSNKNNNREYSTAVLVNANSASASELLAAALKEKFNAEVVGVTTYGKGTVQKTMTLPDGSMIKYTAETWLTSNGNSIDGVGIKPTIEVTLDTKVKEGASETITDNQLEKALEAVTNK